MEMMGTIFAFLGMLPSLIIGIVLFVYGTNGIKGKIKEKSKPFEYYAKVIDIQVEESRDRKGYLISRQYFITVEYESNGELKINTFKSIWDYEINSIIKIKAVPNTKVYSLTVPPQGFVARNKPEHFVTGYKVARVIGIVLICIFIAMVLAQIPIVSNLLAVALMSLFVFIPLYFGLKTYNKAKIKQNDIVNGVYEKYYGKIIDVKRETTDDSTRYYAIVEFEYDGIIYTPTIYKWDVRIENLGQEIPLYIHRETKELLTENDIQTKAVMGLPYVLFGIAGFCAIMLIWSILSNGI